MRFSSEQSKLINSLDFDSSYNDKQISVILKAVNNRSENELESFNISKQRIKKIEMRKKKLGEFKALEDILELDGFGVKVLEKFCDSILTSQSDGEETKDAATYDEEALATSSKKKIQFVTPPLMESFRKSISSCVSFHIDLNFIAWSKLSFFPESIHEASDVRRINVDEWVCYEFGNDDKKLSLSDLIQILTNINEKIPTADAYVVESLQSVHVTKQPGNPVHMNVNTQKAQMLAMLGILMAARDVDKDTTDSEACSKEEAKKRLQKQKVFFLRNFLSSKLYKTVIGSERVSSEHVMENILRYNYSENQPKNLTFDVVDVPDKLRLIYNDSSRMQREFISQAMLNGLTFYKLCVLKCRQSTASLITRKR